MGIEISRLQATEAEAAMEVVTESFNRCVAPDYGSEGRDFFARVVTADYLRSLPGRNGFALVAKDHSRIVGLIAIRDERHITLFFVLPSFQRRGIGRRLFDAALDHVSTVAPLVSELEVHSSPVAVSAYQAFGFVVSAQEKTEEGIRFIPMVRPLGTKSISAYESKSRVAAYDASMDIMHPNRHRMADLIGDVLAACEAPPQMLLDLGTGTGFLLERLLARFSRCASDCRRRRALDGRAGADAVG